MSESDEDVQAELEREKILGMGDDIRQFMQDHVDQLKRKGGDS